MASRTEKKKRKSRELPFADKNHRSTQTTFSAHHDDSPRGQGRPQGTFVGVGNGSYQAGPGDAGGWPVAAVAVAFVCHRRGGAIRGRGLCFAGEEEARKVRLLPRPRKHTVEHRAACCGPGCTFSASLTPPFRLPPPRRPQTATKTSRRRPSSRPGRRHCSPRRRPRFSVRRGYRLSSEGRERERADRETACAGPRRFVSFATLGARLATRSPPSAHPCLSSAPRAEAAIARQAEEHRARRPEGDAREDQEGIGARITAAVATPRPAAAPLSGGVFMRGRTCSSS